MWFHIFVIQSVPFIVSPSAAVLSHRKPVSAEISRDMPALLREHREAEDVFVLAPK
jgi:hypothetical protein